MKKYFKKFGIMFVMTLILSLGFCISAFADDSYVVGTTNLNNTANNSATIGHQLTAPEIGWKRYDDTNSRIHYDGLTHQSGYPETYKLTYTGTGQNDGQGKSYTFKFNGSKFRLISYMAYDHSKSVNVYIDSKLVDSYVEYGQSIVSEALVYEKTNLTFGTHTVKIEDSTNSYLVLDAIDIDQNGGLILDDESISLDKSTMDLNVGDSQQLIATTTPAAVGVTWTSSDTSIATVDSTGNVTGIKEGQVTITATTADGLTATCIVTVSLKGSEPSNPTTGDANLYIELVDGQIKQYAVSQDEINKFTTWYENRDKDHSLAATYKFTKGTYTDYVVHDQIDWFEVR